MRRRPEYGFAILSYLLLAGTLGGCSSEDSPAAAPAVEPPLKVVLKLPDGAGDVKQTANKVEFSLPARTAKTSIDAWKEGAHQRGPALNDSAHSEFTGRVFMTRDLEGLTITYIDGENLPADVIVQAKGAELVVLPTEPSISGK